MTKLNLTPEEQAKLIEALNAGVEPDPHLLPKLFPSTAAKAEKFDVVSLDRAKIPTLEYAGKRSRAAILAEASAGIGAAPLQINRCFGEAAEGEWQNMIVQGDNLQFLKTCYRNEDPLIKDKVKGKVKLIYIDPPFATKSDFGGKEGEKSYTDKVLTSEFLEMLRERLFYAKELLAEDGTIFLHLDQKMGHYVKLVLDEVFSKQNFINEIIWHYYSGGAGDGAYAKKHDNIFMYGKSPNTFFIPQKEKKYVKGKKAGKENLKNATREWFEDEDGVFTHVTKRDVWYVPIINPLSSERVDYPTQKPEQLLFEIIPASSKDGDLIVDLFAGSGTTAAVAEKLGRRWIACDFGKHAIYTMQRRMLRIGESKALQDEKNEAGEVLIKKGDPYGKEPNPFCVISSGAYDFSHVMDLRSHKDRYVNFVLGLFQLPRDEEKAKRFKLANVFAEREGAPVEVYPVWDDQFLKEVRIDEGYLRGLIGQAGGKLKGEYYIITPETCTNLGDTTLKNDEGKEVTFKMLTFPYKVLEDVSRKFTLQDQPSKQEDVNQLISSTAFYFNEDVEIAVERTYKGLKLTKFDTKILNADGERFPGFDGLAMLLIDDNYVEGKPFDMDKTVFRKEIKDDGTVDITDLGENVGVIAIDKHGNESKPYKVT